MGIMSISLRVRSILSGIAVRAPAGLPFVLAAFVVPLVLRALPEIIMGSYVVGFDTLAYYVPTILKLLNQGADFMSFVATAPLFYALLWSLAKLGMPVVVSVKVLSPVLYGFLGLSIFFYAESGLKWSGGKSLVVAILATVYFVTLRISWDMLRNELGLIFFFVALTLLLRNKNRVWDYVGLSVVMIVTVLSHQYVSILLFSTVLATLIFERRLRASFQRASKLVLAAFPSLLLFLLILYANMTVDPSSSVSPESFSAWYVLFGFSSPQATLLDTLGFLLFCYLPLLPLIFLGAKRIHSFQLLTWIVASLVLVVIAVAFPLYNPVGYRWILMLVFPLSFFATEGLLSVKRRGFQVVAVVVLASLTLGFVFLPSQYPLPYYTAYLYYVPSSMLSNTLSLSEGTDALNVLNWANNHIDKEGGLLVHDAFYGWATLVLGQDRIVLYGYGNPEGAARRAFEDGYSQLYLIWWVDGKGWHGQVTVPACFEEIYRSGAIGLFKYARA